MNMKRQSISLKCAILLNGVETKTLQMRRPTVGDLLNAEDSAGSDAESELRFIAALCDAAPEDLKAMDFYDYKEVRKVLGKMQNSAPGK